MLLAIGAILAVAIYGFRATLAGRPLWRMVGSKKTSTLSYPTLLWWTTAGKPTPCIILFRSQAEFIPVFVKPQKHQRPRQWPLLWLLAAVNRNARSAEG
jgi:hypothetical protein